MKQLRGTGSPGSIVNITGDISPLNQRAGVNLHLSAQGIRADDRLASALNEAQRHALDLLFHQPSAKRLIDSGAIMESDDFTLGGVADLEFDIHRDPGPDQHTTVTGDVDVSSVGVVCQVFPYPLQVSAGRLRLNEDGIELLGGPDSEGLKVTTLAGGAGTMTGRVKMSHQDGAWKVTPQLTLDIHDDHIGEMLLASLKCLGADAFYPHL